MTIDIYSHIIPRKYWDEVINRVGSSRIKELDGAVITAVEGTRTLWNLDERFQVMDKFPGLRQVLTPSGPALELLTSPLQAADLARLYNDELAQLVVKYPDRFVAAVAYLPLSDVDAALVECKRAVEELGLRGVFLHTPVYEDSATITKPIDIPELMPLYEMMATYDLPIWLHPRRASSVPEYTTETRSKYVMHQMFGWPFETTVAMARLVYSGIFDHWPNLKVIAHHCGAMVPYLSDRIITQCEWYEKALGAKFLKKLQNPPIDYFHRFYADTAICGNTPALMCGYAFFGADHMAFGTDMPYDEEFGEKYSRDVMHAVEQMEISDLDKQKIFEDNAKRLLGLD